MTNDLEFKLINSFKCKRCGSTNYDKLIYTGIKTLNDKDPILLEKYVCRNCNLPFLLKDYIEDDTIMKQLKTSSMELCNTSNFVDEGVENINKENIKGDKNNV